MKPHWQQYLKKIYFKIKFLRSQENMTFNQNISVKLKMILLFNSDGLIQ